MSGFAERTGLLPDVATLRRARCPAAKSKRRRTAERELADRALTALAPLLIDREACRFRVTPEQVLGRGRSFRPVAARRAVAKALRVVPTERHAPRVGLPVMAIGNILGGRDHTAAWNLARTPCPFCHALKAARRTVDAAEGELHLSGTELSRLRTARQMLAEFGDMPMPGEGDPVPAEPVAVPS